MDKVIKIGAREVGEGRPVYVIAEIGSNHDKSLPRAKELIKAAKDSGADAAKFQSFTAEGLFNPMKPGDGDGSVGDFSTWVEHPAYSVIDSLELKEEWHYELKEYADNIGIDLLSAPFDAGRAVLLDKLNLPAIKIASGDVTNEPLLKLVASFGRPVIISTGASYLKEVERAVEVVRSAGNDNIALLHCVALYPPRFEDANIRAMVTKKEATGCPVGYSDHAPGSVVPVAAVALGASIIEKHITLSRDLAGPDHPYALEVGEFASMVYDIHNLQKALGDGVKRPLGDEEGERTGARRSIYARAPIKAGEVLTDDNLKVVRHAFGLEPARLDSIKGLMATRDFSANELISLDGLSGGGESDG